MDVIVVDDLKLYEDGPFENGQISDNFANIPLSWRTWISSMHFFLTKLLRKII